MTREEISNSIAEMMIRENISPITSAIDCYNHWVQSNRIIISDPDVAVWALKHIKSLLATNKAFLTGFIND